MRIQLSKEQRFRVLHRDKFTCQYCGRSAPDVVLQVDHVHPVSKGGGNHISNLTTACQECNEGKSAMLLYPVEPVKKLDIDPVTVKLRSLF